jgi:hypothetical protein
MRTLIDTMPVLVTVRGAMVLIEKLARTPDGLAIDSHARLVEVGTVIQARVPGKRNGHALVWWWSADGKTGDAKTKARAVADMLAQGGFHQVPDTATIPDLLEGLL